MRQQIAVIKSKEGHKVIGQQQPYLLILEKGEEIISALTQFAIDAELKGALFSGIGAITDVEIGYYDTHNKNYKRQLFTDEYELISLTGNLSSRDANPYVHIHLVFGDVNFQTMGGHLFSAKIAVTGEISVTPLMAMPRREMDEEIGLALICSQT